MVDDALREVLATLVTGGWSEAEVYAKTGRSRTLALGPRREVSTLRREEGWTARAGDRRRSFFLAHSGRPRADLPWPEADGLGLRLPSAQPVPSWTAPANLDAPLIGENEAHALVRGIARALDSELPGARLIRAELEDGSSEAQLVSSREMSFRVRGRVATLRLEAVLAKRPGRSVSLVQATREARRFHPVAVARRLADQLLVGEQGSSPPRDRGEMLLAPPVTAALLQALLPLFVGPDAAKLAAGLAEHGGRIAARGVSVVDDGRLPGGLLESPVDGEGVPSRRVRLVDDGLIGQPLLAWHQTPTRPRMASGCSRRHGWRDLPTPGPTHLYLAPDPDLTVAALLADVARGYYLLDLEGAPAVDVANDRFAVPVCGFGLDRGRAVGTVTGAWLVGSVRSLLAGIVATARDLTFLPLRGMIGAPTVLVRGLELRRTPRGSLSEKR